MAAVPGAGGPTRPTTFYRRRRLSDREVSPQHAVNRLRSLVPHHESRQRTLISEWRLWTMWADARHAPTAASPSFRRPPAQVRRETA